MDLNRRMMLAALAGGAASLYRIPGAAAQAAEDMKKIEAAAKSEGRVIVYSAYVGAPSSKAIAAGFEKKYGIRVELLEVRGSEIRERVRVEQAAGRFQGDVLFSSVGQVWLHETVDKTVDPLPQVPNLSRLTKDFKAEPAFAPTMVIPYGILYNTNLVKAEEAPKSWADLADPKWKGKILADDFRAIGGGYMTMFAMHDNFGVPYLEKIAANAPVFTRDQRESQRRTARGEYPIYIPFILTDIPSLKGLPVKHVIPSEGVTYILYGNALLKGAPRANAARLYIDYCLSEEGQLIYANSGHGATTVDIGSKLSPEIREIATAKLWGTSDTKRQNEMLALAKKLFG
jgi:iron(III) transport system substrate-binding protein